jgi:hypothetical protein
MWKDLSDEELASPGQLLAPDGKLGRIRAFIIAEEQGKNPRYADLVSAIRQIAMPHAEHP